MFCSSSIIYSQGQEYPTYNTKKEGYWIGHILRRKCLLKDDIEGRIKGKSGGKTRNKM
jgi:hypothetical protein